MESLIIIKSRTPILRAFMTFLPSIAPIQFGKYHSSLDSFAIPTQSFVVLGAITYCPWLAVQIAAQVSLIICDTVTRPIRNKNDCDCWESPVAKNLSATISLSAAEIVCLDRHDFLVKRGPTTDNECSKRSGAILKNLQYKQ